MPYAPLTDALANLQNALVTAISNPQNQLGGKTIDGNVEIDGDLKVTGEIEGNPPAGG